MNLRDLDALRKLSRGGKERRCVQDRQTSAALEGGDGEGGRHCALNRSRSYEKVVGPNTSQSLCVSQSLAWSLPMYFFASPTFDSLLFCLAKPSHLRCELMLAPPLDVVGSSLTPREMKLPSAGLLLPAAAQVAAPKVHSRVCHFGKATASSRSIPKKDQPPEHHRKLVADAIGKRFGQGAF